MYAPTTSCLAKNIYIHDLSTNKRKHILGKFDDTKEVRHLFTTYEKPVVYFTFLNSHCNNNGTVFPRSLNQDRSTTGSTRSQMTMPLFEFDASCLHHRDTFQDHRRRSVVARSRCEKKKREKKNTKQRQPGGKGNGGDEKRARYSNKWKNSTTRSHGRCGARRATDCFHQFHASPCPPTSVHHHLRRSPLHTLFALSSTTPGANATTIIPRSAILLLLFLLHTSTNPLSLAFLSYLSLSLFLSPRLIM